MDVVVIYSEGYKGMFVDNYHLVLTQYIVLNPLRAGMVSHHQAIIEAYASGEFSYQQIAVYF